MQTLLQYRQAVIHEAEKCLGMGEHPPASNRGELPDAANTFAGAPLGSPWCCAGACLMAHRAGVPNPPRTASTGALVDWGRENGAIVRDLSLGDFGCVIDHNSPTGYRHTVIVTGGTPDALRTIEFNEGNQVKRWFRKSSELTGINIYVHVPAGE